MYISIDGVTLIGPKFINQVIDKVWLIRKWLKITQCQQKYYADVRRRNFSFDVNGFLLENFT